ncbi:MAG: ParB N-terminal domain-containing protein [Bacillota bacterium]|jgi:ParB-like chromosome segregation protein Spo0J
MATREQVNGLYSFALIDSAALVPHERVDQERLLLLVREIARDGVLHSPVMVDRSSLVILDGHHRVNALRLLGCHLTPVYLVDYGHPSITVSQWRDDIRVNKETVIKAGLSGNLYPPRASKHEWGLPPGKRPVPLSLLRIPAI